MTDKNPAMAPEERKARDRKAQRIVSDLRRKWKTGELSEEQVSQLESLGITKHTIHDVVAGINDLATTCPELAAQWHPAKNGGLTPQDVKAGSNRKVWWQCECGHEWEAGIASRRRGNGCPYCSKQRAIPGVNDLATVNPELAAQWHPVRNRHLALQDVMVSSNKKAWWKCERGHEWEATVASRSKGAGCPVCAGRKAMFGFNDLATTHPCLDAQWHPARNGDLTPQDVTAGSNRKVWWLGECGHEWEATVADRSNGTGCPFCSGNRVLPGFNDLATTHPCLAAQWHPTRNGDLTPQDLMSGSGKKVWWRCENGHEWEAAVYNRSNGRGCPFCSGKRVLPGYNDLATTNPDLAAQWHPVRNGNLTPQDVTAGSNKKVWWLGECGHEWEATVASRSNGNGCPVCYRNALKKKDGQR